MKNTLTPSQEEIALRAYHLYLDGGCQHGKDRDYWFQAEKELGAKFFNPPPAPTVSSAASNGKKAPAKKAAAKKAPAAEKAPAKKAGKKPAKKSAE
jgi:hypothetical protein